MRILWQLRMITLLVILSSGKRIAFCQNVRVCSVNQMCTCRMEETRSEVMCFRVPFYKLPDLSPEQYAHIDVMSSNLEIIENDAFGMAQIESLRLMNNHIMLLEHRAFSSMENVLRSLDLSYNKLTSFPYKALRGVNHLDWLNLHSNEISAVDAADENIRSWSRLKETLQTLYLSDNDISVVPEGTLNSYKRLTWLNVDVNELWNLPATNLPITLRTLSYCQNYIHDFPIDVLERISDLSRLYVRGNYLTQFPLHLIRTPRRLDKLDLGENFIAFSNNTNLEHVLTIRDLHLDVNRIRSLPAHSFRGLSVARLYLSRNDIETVDDQAFVDLANTLEYLDLENNNLQEIPTGLNELKRLKYLYISSNRIANVSDTVMESVCPSLKAVSLAANQLTRVPKSALQKCTKMSHLDLGYNCVQEVSEQDFKGWGSALDTLLLRNNHISEIPAHTFKQTPQLRELNLSFNKMASVHEDAFAELKLSLESLEISFNLFQEEFAGEFLKPLTSLMWLALDNNNINTLTANVFHSLDNLQYLNLDMNSLTDIPVDLLSPKFHKHIKDVRFSNNHLDALRARTFVDLPELQNINLSRNQIRKLESRSFANLPNAVELILSGNRIEKIESQAFVNLPNLMRIDLQHNRLAILQLSAFVNVSRPTTSLSLNVSSNGLREIEVDVGAASTNTSFHLKYLDASANNFQNIPHALLTLCAHAITKLELGFNHISKINENAFRNLTQLEVLILKSNLIAFVHKRGFLSLDTLQILDLSDNRIEYLLGDTFDSTKRLRILNLSKNKLRALSRDLFASTALESVDLSGNLFGVLPSSTISEVGNTLRKLDLSNNHIEHLDSTMLADVPALSTLNLAANKLNILPDNVFTSVANLLTLDLSVNPLRANFKELFHYVQKLRNLNLAETGLHEMPHLPLPNLVSLRLSHNRLQTLSSTSVQNLVQLRRLYLDNNRLRALPSNVWQYLVLLKELDISNNPIKVLSKEGLLKLPRLQSLNIKYLQHLERFDVDSFAQNKLLTNLKLDTYPTVDKNKFRLGKTLSSVPSLRTLSVRVLEEKLDNQLVGSFHPKLKEVEITGSNLRYIQKGALKGIEQTYDLILRIRDTKIEDFPAGLFEGIQQITHLSLDLSNNRLVALSPAVFYSNVTNWENVGTKILDGGLILKDNPLICDCGLVWLGHWLRRWLRETVEIHTMMITEAQQIENMAREATCLDQRTNKRISIVDLHAEDLSCQASALSGDSTSSHLLGNHLLGCLIKTVLIVSLTRYLWAI